MTMLRDLIPQEEINADLELLNDDSFYYGETGQKYLSKSSAGDLLRNPSNFGKKKEDNINFALGSYFHYSLIEPEKAELNTIDVSSRIAKKYKDAVRESGKPYIPLKKEKDALDELIEKVKSNHAISDIIYQMDNRYEVPAVKNIKGLYWKGKCDILTDEHVIDLKTTGDINRFRYSAKAYDYDLQAYLYKEFFNREFVFIVACKKTHQLGLYYCSDEFYLSGERKAEKAVANYNKFFGPQATEDPEQYFFIENL